MNQSFTNEATNLLIATVSFIALLVIVFFVYKHLFLFFKKRVFKTPAKLDDFILDLFKIPALWVIFWILLKLFTHIFLSDWLFFPYLLHSNELLLIIVLPWIAIKFVKLGSFYFYVIWFGVSKPLDNSCILIKK